MLTKAHCQAPQHCLQPYGPRVAYSQKENFMHDRTPRASAILTLITCHPIYRLVWQQSLACSFSCSTLTATNLWSFPFDKNFWFAFSENFVFEWSTNFWKRRKPHGVYPSYLNRISILFDSFPLGISGSFDWMVRI